MSLSIGENIRTMRRCCGFTQEELAARLSVTPQAVSKWENGNGTPDISQLVPLAQLFGITTDTLLGVEAAVYGEVHVKAVEGHVRLLLSTSAPEPEKRLAAYNYCRAESEREPTNYTIMQKCIGHGGEISRYVDFDGFLSDNAALRDEIFADCERKNALIARYCEERGCIEKSDYSMAWIYIHLKQFDKAKRLIERLPSLESNRLRESIESQLVHFQYGFEREKQTLADNVRKLLRVTAKEFFYSLEDYAWYEAGEAAITQYNGYFSVLEAYRSIDGTEREALEGELLLRKFMPRCLANLGDYAGAAAALAGIERCCAELAALGSEAEAQKEVKSALDMVDEEKRAAVVEARG